MALEVPLELNCFGAGVKGDHDLDPPWSILGSVRYLAGIVCSQPVIKVFCDSCVVAVLFRLAHKDVNVVKARHFVIPGVGMDPGSPAPAIQLRSVKQAPFETAF